MKRFKLSLRGAKLALFAYIAFDIFFGGYCGGFLPLNPMAAAQTAPSIAFLGQSFGYQHRVGSTFYAPGYATYNGTIVTGNSATGSATIVVTDMAGGSGGANLLDGTVVQFAVLFNTNTPITILDANQETVTPTAVSIGNCPPGTLGLGQVIQCATITATFANTHGGSATVVSGDAGIEEAITDAGLQGGGNVYWIADTGVVTLNTGGLTTTTTTKVPTTFYSQGCSARVVTTITVTASWSVGTTAGAATNFCAAQATLTAGTVGIPVSPALVGTGSTALTTVTIVGVTSNPGAGAVKARLFGYTPVSATQ